MVRRDRILSTLRRGRAAAEALMRDTCVIRRPTGGIVVDPDTGVATPGTRTVYEGPCRVQASGGVASQVVSASGESTNVGGNVPVWTLYLHLPVSAGACRSGDIALVTHSVDSSLTGRRLRLVNLQSEKSLATARRWNVSEMPREGSDVDPPLLETWWTGEPNNSPSVLRVIGGGRSHDG